MVLPRLGDGSALEVDGRCEAHELRDVVGAKDSAGLLSGIGEEVERATHRGAHRADHAQIEIGHRIDRVRAKVLVDPRRQRIRAAHMHRHLEDRAGRQFAGLAKLAQQREQALVVQQEAPHPELHRPAHLLHGVNDALHSA